MPPSGLFLLGEAHKGRETAIKADLGQEHRQVQKGAYLGLILTAACSSPAGSLAIQRVQPQIRMTPRVILHGWAREILETLGRESTR